jgi:hypothetical protein
LCVVLPNFERKKDETDNYPDICENRDDLGEIKLLHSYRQFDLSAVFRCEPGWPLWVGSGPWQAYQLSGRFRV